MGDIVLGTTIIIFILVAAFINKKSSKPDTEKLIRILIGLGAALGLLVSFAHHGMERILGLIIFYLQLTSVVLLSANKSKFSYNLLCLTLLLQIPIIRLEEFSYRSQNLLGFNIQDHPKFFLDIEPGSYLIYFEQLPHSNLFPLGFNVTSLFLLIYFIRRRWNWLQQR